MDHSLSLSSQRLRACDGDGDGGLLIFTYDGWEGGRSSRRCLRVSVCVVAVGRDRRPGRNIDLDICTITNLLEVSTFGTNDDRDQRHRSVDDERNLYSTLSNMGKAGSKSGKAYDGAEQRKEAPLCLVEFLLGLGFDVEGSLANFLVCRSFNLDLVLGIDLPNDFTESGGLSVLASGREVDSWDGERLGDLVLL